MMVVIPALDLKDGRCVRLVQGDFGRQTDYGDAPVEVAHRYRELGFDHLHLVDLDGALTGVQRHHEIVSSITDAAELTVQLGGGIRSRETIANWLDAGVSRCVIGSLAVTEPWAVLGWLEEFGSDRIVLALDVRADDHGTPLLATHGWTRSTEITLWECLDGYCGNGLSHVLCTDIGVDGTCAGPNAALYRDILRRYPDLELQASGGVRHIGDLRTLRGLGCSAAITGRALLDGRIRDEEISSFPRNE
ncbi:MAG: 1-(5-phosphoribosyl)-5-[(5-phosphoribosylamino)methylideneamino]imidazole-4-carboxamide isomerase [Woeseia sp.]